MAIYNIIAIEREYASGGRDIGKAVAAELGIPFYGKEILELTAGKTGATVEQLEYFEETATNSLLYTIAAMSRSQSGEPLPDPFSRVEADVIEEIAGRQNCVFVGRAAGWVLRERTDVFKVFIRADMDYRRRRGSEEYGVDPQKVDSVIKKSDKRRSNYYKALSGKRWGETSDFHMVLDGGKLGIKKCAKLILAAVKE